MAILRLCIFGWELQSAYSGNVDLLKLWNQCCTLKQSLRLSVTRIQQQRVFSKPRAYDISAIHNYLTVLLQHTLQLSNLGFMTLMW